LFTTQFSQFDVTPINSGNFFQPGNTYMVEVRGLVAGVPTGSGAMLTIVKRASTRYTPPVSQPQFIDNFQCQLMTSPTVMCTFSRGTTTYKRIKALSTCYSNGGSVNFFKKILRYSDPASFTQTLSSNAECYIRIKASYRNKPRIRRRFIIFT